LALLITVGALFPCYLLTAPPLTLLLPSPGPALPRCALPAHMAVPDLRTGVDEWVCGGLSAWVCCSLMMPLAVAQGYSRGRGEGYL
jgi:hypothetical protein